MTVELDPDMANDLETLLEEVGTANLEPISPDEAIDLYLNDRAKELRESSVATHRSALSFFSEWCANQDITNLNELTGRHLQAYRVWRRDEAPTKVDSLSPKSEKTQQDILRSFIRYCETIDAVKSGLHNKVRSPSLARGEAARDDLVSADRATEICQWLRKYEYATTHDVTWELLANTGMRTGSLRALDIDDYHPTADVPYLELRHRPETGTPLKNGTDGERLIALSDELCAILDDYLAVHRPDVTDEFGREPLIVAGQNRIATSTIRKYVYMWTRPCAIGKECPHDRTPEECAATLNNAASKCPSSQAGHAVRRGYITHALKAGVDRSYVSERCNVSEAVIKDHYDERDEHDRMQARVEALRDVGLNATLEGGE